MLVMLLTVFTGLPGLLAIGGLIFAILDIRSLRNRGGAQPQSARIATATAAADPATGGMAVSWLSVYSVGETGGTDGSS